MIEFQSKLDGSKTAAINRHVFKRFWWLFAILSAVFVIFGILGMVFQEDSSDFAFGIFMIVVGVCFTPLTLLLTKLMQKRIDKSAVYINSDTVEIFVFDDEKITVKQSLNDVFSSVVEAKYSYLYKVIETDENYILYISKQLCHVADKRSITSGTLQELNSLLRNKLGDKFKPHKK